MIADFEIVLCCLAVICFAVMFYLAGKGDFLTLVPKIFLDKLEELNRKHGEWIEETIPLEWDADDVVAIYECSICKTKTPFTSSYCPECGAKMDLKRGDSNASHK